MKDRTWIIVTIIMGLALIISVGYSLKLRKKINDKSEVIVSRSIVQITASNVSIKNVLTAKGKVEKSYLISLNLNEETMGKVKIGQEVDIKIKNDNKTLKYKGKLTKIEQDEINNKKKAIVEFNFDENVKENQEAECTIIIEKAKDVIALPLVAIKTRKLNNNTDDNMQNNINIQNQSNITNDQNSVNTIENIPKEEKYVIVVNDDGTTGEVVVETGISDEYYVEIVSGLSEGQKVQIEEE